MDQTEIDALDGGIRAYVMTLREHGVETFESCEGGPGHAYPEPTVRFHGERAEGFRALAVAQTVALPVSEIRRVRPIIAGEPTGPRWEMPFRTRAPDGEAVASSGPLPRRHACPRFPHRTRVV